MKKNITITLLILLVIGLCSCGTKNPMQDALTATRNTGSIEIRVYSNTDQTYTDYVITDRATVREICDYFGALELEKVKIAEPLSVSYTIKFCNTNGVGVESLTVVAGYNVIEYGGQYRVQDDVNIHEYVESIIAKAQPKE